ncbi:MAG TPA: selenocysteine-specific translation elongation factor [Nannocystaceae bacterium]|nr:selenocysteine-specific translation elongation factor [Nannocystaceae bacterium]
MSKAPHSLVLGTAGHIDHGKTTLVAALTGVDTDRLPEEKRRGITIELGFAPWKVAPDLEASIVDVPGHEGFVRTMVAGAGGIDAVMLVVSAEDGVMPQTREHVNVCRLLGVAASVVALTKIDRLDDPDAIELAIEDVRSALADTPFADAPIVPCSAVTKVGLDVLRDTVRSIAATLPRRDASGPVILPLDRAFTIKGHGTVVTGTLLSGSIDLRADEDLVLVPHGDREPRNVRARAAQVRLEGRERIGAGNRIALNLAIEASAVERGDVIARGDLVARQSFVHARLHHLAGRDHAWKSGTTLQVCAGTAHGIGVLDPLWVEPTPDRAASSEVEPGGDALVRIRLQSPLPCWRGQRIVLRAFDEPDVRTGRTVGGGTIVDPEPSSGRGQRARWTALGRALEQPDANARLSALLDDAGAVGIGNAELARRAGVHDPAQLLARRTGPKGGDVVQLAHGRWVLERSLRPLGEAAIAIVDRFHAQNPLQAGIPRAVLEAKLDDPQRGAGKVAPEVAAAAIERAIERRVLRVVDEQGTIARPGKGLQTGGELPGHMKTVLDRYAAGGITPPTLKEVGDATGFAPRDVLENVAALQRMGRLVKITDDLSLAREAHDELVERIRKHLAAEGTIDVQALKQLTGLTRKFAVPLLEHMDGLQVTLRRGDTRIPGPRA